MNKVKFLKVHSVSYYEQIKVGNKDLVVQGYQGWKNIVQGNHTVSRAKENSRYLLVKGTQ